MSTILLNLLFTAATLKYKLPPELLSSLCYIESNHTITAIHKDDGTSNSVGICQVKLKTAKSLGFKGTEKQLMNPSINIEYAAKYLAFQQHRYHSITKAVVAYNRGNAKNLTRSKYSDKVIKYWRKKLNERRKCESNSCEYRP